MSIQEQIDLILDKLIKFNKDVSCLDDIELKCLQAYASNDDEVIQTAFVFDDARTYISEKKYFIFKLSHVAKSNGIYKFYGTLLTPDYYDEQTSTTVHGAMYGYILYFPKTNMIVPYFEKDGIDVLSFCENLEYELDVFLEHICETVYVMTKFVNFR